MKFLILFYFLPLTIISQQVISMEEKNGVYLIPCKVNGIPMKFIFDTGASNVSISKTEALFLFKQGLINLNDIVGDSEYTIANGNVEKGMLINLRSIEIDGIVLENIIATVIENDNAPLLLGQNVIQKLGNISFSGNKLILNDKNILPKCSFGNLFPFKIGNNKLEISQLQNSLKTIKEQSDEFGLNKIFDEYEIGWKNFKNVDEQIYINVIKLDYVDNKCLLSKRSDVRLVLANDFLYKALISAHYDKTEYDLMYENFSEIISSIPNEYKFLSSYFLKDADTNEKIGEGIKFYTEAEENRNKKKIKQIEVYFQTTFNGTVNKDQTIRKTGEVLYHTIYVNIVDLEKTPLTTEDY